MEEDHDTDGDSSSSCETPAPPMTCDPNQDNKKWFEFLSSEDIDHITAWIQLNPTHDRNALTIRARNIPTVDFADEKFGTIASVPLYNLYRSILTLLITSKTLTEFQLVTEETENEGIYILVKWLLAEELPPRVRKVSITIGENTYSITEGSMVAALVLGRSITPMVAALISNSLRDMEFSRVSIYGTLSAPPEPIVLEMLLEWIRHLAPPTLRLMGMGMNMGFLDTLFRTLPLERLSSIELDVFEYLPMYILGDRGCTLKRIVIAGETPLTQVIDTFISRIRVPHAILARVPIPSPESLAGMSGIVHLTILHTKYTSEEMMRLGAGLNRIRALEILEFRDAGDYLTLIPWLTGCLWLRHLILDTGQEGWLNPIFRAIPTLESIRLSGIRYTRPMV